MVRATSLRIPQPTRLLCVGAHSAMALKLQQQLLPHFAYCAILAKLDPAPAGRPGKETYYSLENFELVLDTLYPPPDGVIVGGGISEEEGDAMRKVTAARKDEHGEPIKFVKVPTGTLEETGPEGLVRTVKQLLSDAFCVQW